MRKLWVFVLAGLVAGLMAGPSLVEGQFGYSGRIPKMAEPPPCNVGQEGNIYYDTDDDAFYGCDGSSWATLGGVDTTLTVGTQNTIAKFGAADLADSRITDDGADVTITTEQLDILGSNPYIGLPDNALTYIGDVTDSSSESFSGYIAIQSNSAGGDAAANVEIGGQTGSNSPSFTVVSQADTVIGNTGGILFQDQVPLMNGSDSQIFLRLDPSESNATGSGNTYTVLNIDAHTVDAEKTSTAILIEPTYNYGLSILADGSATDDNITLGASQTADAQIYWDGADLAIDVDGTAANGILASIGNDTAGGAAFTVQNAGLANQFIFIGSNTSNAGFNVFEIEVASIIATDGSDVVNMLDLDWNETDWATSTEALNAINIEGITQDSGEGVYTAIKVDGTGWDYGLSIMGDGSAISNNITFGASQATDAQLYFDGGGLVLDTDGAAGNDIELKLFNDFNSRFQVGNSGVGNYFETQANTSAGNGNSFYYFLVSDSAGVNGSDMTDILKIEWNDTSWATGTGNELRGVNVDDLTADADVTNIGVRVGTGWDIGVKSAAKRVDDVQTETCLTGGGACTFTLTPTSSYVEIACQDANSCDGTMSETGAVEGQILDIVIIEEVGATDWADDAGVLNIAGAYAMGIDDTLRLRYTGALWVEVSRSDN